MPEKYIHREAENIDISLLKRSNQLLKKQVEKRQQQIDNIKSIKKLEEYCSQFNKMVDELKDGIKIEDITSKKINLDFLEKKIKEELFIPEEYALNLIADNNQDNNWKKKLLNTFFGSKENIKEMEISEATKRAILFLDQLKTQSEDSQKKFWDSYFKIRTNDKTINFPDIKKALSNLSKENDVLKGAKEIFIQDGINVKAIIATLDDGTFFEKIFSAFLNSLGEKTSDITITGQTQVTKGWSATQTGNKVSCKIDIGFNKNWNFSAKNFTSGKGSIEGGEVFALVQSLKPEHQENLYQILYPRKNQVFIQDSKSEFLQLFNKIYILSAISGWSQYIKIEGSGKTQEVFANLLLVRNKNTGYVSLYKMSKIYNYILEKNIKQIIDNYDIQENSDFNDLNNFKDGTSHSFMYRKRKEEIIKWLQQVKKKSYSINTNTL